jgi:hypothetical protein
MIKPLQVGPGQMSTAFCSPPNGTFGRVEK